MEVLHLPAAAEVNRPIPKKKIYENAGLSRKQQKEFGDTIQQVTWKYKLAENTIGISGTGRVEEIHVFDINLKEKVYPKRQLTIIDSIIPYPILYILHHENSMAYGIALKSGTNIERYYFSDWNREMHFDFMGITLENVYEKIVRVFLPKAIQQLENFSEAITLDSTIRYLDAEIALLEKSIAKEKQFNRKVELNKVLLNKRKSLLGLRNNIIKSQNETFDARDID